VRLTLSTSPSPERNAFYLSCLDRCLHGILDTLQKKNVAALLLIGAPARGEATVVRTPDGLYSLSDVDLVCVPAEGQDPQLLGKTLARWTLRANEELGDTCSGVDVSIRTRRQLAALCPNMSHYEMARSPALVWGDATVLSSLPRLDVRQVPPADSLVLLHNRLVEELLLHRQIQGPPGDARTALDAIYGTVKLALDAATALLYLERDVPFEYVRRVEVFLGDVLKKPEYSTLCASLRDYTPDLPVFARFKTTGDIEGLAAHFSRTADAPGLAALAAELWHRYVGYAEALWPAVLGRVVGVATDAADLDDVVGLYGRIESLPRSVARTLRILRPGAAPTGLFSPGRALARSLVASPRQLAYLTAVVTYLGFSDDVSQDWVVSVVQKYCPFPLQGFAGKSREERTAFLLDKLDLFHESVLLGRRPGAGT
jgi:hypothetical protein